MSHLPAEPGVKGDSQSPAFVDNWSGLVTKDCLAGVIFNVIHFQLTKDLVQSPLFKVEEF